MLPRPEHNTFHEKGWSTLSAGAHSIQKHPIEDSRMQGTLSCAHCEIDNLLQCTECERKEPDTCCTDSQFFFLAPADTPASVLSWSALAIVENHMLQPEVSSKQRERVVFVFNSHIPPLIRLIIRKKFSLHSIQFCGREIFDYDHITSFETILKLCSK